MPLKKTPTYIALLDFLRSYKSVEKLLDVLFVVKQDNDGLREFIGYNNPTEHFLHLEDGYDNLDNNYHKDLVKICEFFASTHYKLGEKHTIFIRKNYLEELKVLQSSLDNFLIEGFFIYSKFVEYDRYEGLRFLKQSIYHDKFTKNSIVPELDSLSDLHTHLGSNMKIEYRINDMLSYPSEVSTKELPLDVFIALNANMCKEDLFFILSSLERVIVNTIISPKDSQENVLSILKLLSQKNYLALQDSAKGLFQIRQDKHWVINDVLLNEAYKYFLKDKIVYADRYLIMCFIQLLYRSKNRYVITAIKIYFILRNILKSILVQQHRQVGFGYFSSYSRSTLRRAKKLSEKKDIIQSMIHLSNQLNKPIHIEARITPSKTVAELKEDLQGYLEAFDENTNHKMKLRFIYHFIKKKNPINGKNRFEKLKIDLKAEAIMLVDFLAAEKDNLNLAKYFAGIDAASKEYHTPPYVFSPIYRYFKSTKKLSSFYHKYKVSFIERQTLNFPKSIYTIEGIHKISENEKTLNNTESKSINTKYTYHVGEDFRDILTGIRSIFEAVLFLDMRDSDRIGHGIALGLDSELFYERQGKIELSKEELFNNMIFVYYLLDIYNNDDLREYKFYAKQTILELGRYIYADVKDINYCCIDDFIDAWFYRRNCFIELKIMLDRFDISIENIKDIKKFKECMLVPDLDYTLSALPDFFDITFDEDDVFENRYDTVRNNHNALKIYMSYMGEPNTLSTKKSRYAHTVAYSNVIERGAEIYTKNIKFSSKVVTYLQKIIKKKMIIKRGISLEVMPTSNLLISHIQSHKEHPMYTFKSLDKKQDLQIFIASDNPMLQNTNIAQEYDYVYTYLKKKYGEKRASVYLAKIAKESEREFYR